MKLFLFIFQGGIFIMYRNYKIDSDGTQKYDGTGYHIAPERRSTESTDEWKKRLKGNTPKAHRRRVPKQNSTFTLQVKHIVYAIALFVFIGIFGKTSPYMFSNGRIDPSINITLSSAVTDTGNAFINPSTGNMFLHVDLSLENLSNNIENINMYDFTLIDENGKSFKPSYYDYQSKATTKDLTPDSKSIEKLTFEVPISYKGELELLFDSANSYTENITTFRIQ